MEEGEREEVRGRSEAVWHFEYGMRTSYWGERRGLCPIIRVSRYLLFLERLSGSGGFRRIEVTQESGDWLCSLSHRCCWISCSPPFRSSELQNAWAIISITLALFGMIREQYLVPNGEIILTMVPPPSPSRSPRPLCHSHLMNLSLFPFSSLSPRSTKDLWNIKRLLISLVFISSNRIGQQSWFLFCVR